MAPIKYYFDDSESIYAKLGAKAEPIIETIAYRYIGQNPVNGPVYRVFSRAGFIRASDYRYIIDFDQKYPEAEYGNVCYAWGKLWSDTQADLRLAITCQSPSLVFCNERFVFKSDIIEETNDTVKKEFIAQLEPGWNQIVIKCKKVRSGFGCVMGTGSFKRSPFHFLAPTPEREGQEGLIYSEPFDEEWEMSSLKDLLAQGKIKWYPEMSWDQAKAKQGQFERIFGLKSKGYGLAWTQGEFDAAGKNDYEFSGSSDGAITLYLGGKEIFHSPQALEFHQKISVQYGAKDIMVKCGSGPKGWGFELAIRRSRDGELVKLKLPFDVKGTADSYVYAGVFDESSALAVGSIGTCQQLFPSVDGPTYWQVDQPNSCVRVYHENELFGKWNYPLGVTLYGLLQSGVVFKKEDLFNYVRRHIQFCTSYYQYSLWDRKQYGAAGINSQISGVDSLDDCGAFAATMLELMHYSPDVAGASAVADDVAHYIMNVQSRCEDGALYRRRTYNPFMELTLWADDLYMSIPFLCKYYRLTGKNQYIDDAVKQILHYKNYLYMPDLKIMSHVYSFRYNTATGIPWGRGNGWVFFALSELLSVLPEDHASRDELIGFYNELSEGYLKLQDKAGMWRQVLTDADSYVETSCTSMFICGFARGIRHGWIKNQEPLIKAVFKGWEGLAKIAIDKNGNIYGVCRGSGYSFSADYYKHDLSWLLNDTHGIGIVMLAGTEVDRLQAFLNGVPEA